MARKKRRAYATDLTDTQWMLIAPLIPEAEPGGRPREATTRELVNAILYFVRAGMAWRLLPHDLPPWQTVYYYLWAGSARACGTGSIMRWSWPTASAPAERPARPPPSSTANRSRRLIKRGIEGLRRGQEDQRPQAPHPDRHRWAAVHPKGPFRRQWQDGAQGLTRKIPLVTRAFADGGYAG